ncbi:hypothetical protein [Arthrobacter cryoconiti]|uniref:Uncharacterized protein n=1 Tax=Arthrobacter cryoconiti TaxID=748907 RepID=A0ABV8R6Q4_9MICC|nr:hypothetical protein [Arthrobacter cryoconiti]
MHSLILLAETVSPNPQIPTLRPGLSEDQITPGLLGFVITFSIVIVMFFLIRDMIRRVRRVRYRAQVSDGGGSHGPRADYIDIPIMSDEAVRAAGFAVEENSLPSSKKQADAGDQPSGQENARPTTTGTGASSGDATQKN